MTIRYDGQVAIVTGSGQGLGRCHAIELAARAVELGVGRQNPRPSSPVDGRE